MYNIQIITTQPQKRYTEEEYLEMEREADYKSEYYRGEIFGMGGAGFNHNRITENLSGECYIRLNGTSCKGYSSDLKIYIPHTGLYTYPDFLIICGENKFRDDKKDTVSNPTVIVEVLSPSTSGYDRGEKFHLYRSIPTLREYAVIDSLSIASEVWRKGEAGMWFLASEAYTINDFIELDSVGIRLQLSDI